jgi:hypothetical protein
MRWIFAIALSLWAGRIGSASCPNLGATESFTYTQHQAVACGSVMCDTGYTLDFSYGCTANQSTRCVPKLGMVTKIDRPVVCIAGVCTPQEFITTGVGKETKACD